MLDKTDQLKVDVTESAVLGKEKSSLRNIKFNLDKSDLSSFFCSFVIKAILCPFHRILVAANLFDLNKEKRKRKTQLLLQRWGKFFQLGVKTYFRTRVYCY